ncbi:DUF916 domain-containing protein [Parafrankia sp. EUN1f]|uniref:DUF916 domain-containing protein n=1 Tax=Parafrankia sp. EUN1f TaxID=102897 RepID=UPI001E4B5454|nr:DUF916 domain-containing protein [Parafrankia sp. EUN1f]
MVDVPADAVDDPRARIYIVDHLNPGTVIQRRISVSNLSDTERRLAVYAGAASVERGGFNVSAGRTPNELTTWITIDRPLLTLQPHEEATVTAKIAVPRDASPGEHYAAIWAETGTTHATRNKNVVEVSRVGVRTYLSVGPGGPPPADFAIAGLSSSRLPDGRPVATAQIRNTGGRALDMTGELGLTRGPGGLSAGPFPARLGKTLAPGQSEPVMVTLDKQLPAGPWTALIRLKSGLTERTARAVITFPQHSGESRSGKMLPLSNNGYLTAGVIGILLLAALSVLVLRRRRRRSSRERESA